MLKKFRMPTYDFAGGKDCATTNNIIAGSDMLASTNITGIYGLSTPASTSIGNKTTPTV